MNRGGNPAADTAVGRFLSWLHARSEEPLESFL